MSKCPKKNWFLMITGVEAPRVKILPALMAIDDGYRMNISIMNNKIVSIEDFNTKEMDMKQPLTDLRAVVFKNNTDLVLRDCGRDSPHIERIIFCKDAVNRIYGYSMSGWELRFIHLESFSMKFSYEENDDQFSRMFVRKIYIEGIMLDIFLPIDAYLDSVVIKNVQSLQNTELLQANALSLSTISKELRIENSIHVTLPENLMNGRPVDKNLKMNSIDFVLDPWNLQKNTFAKAVVPYIKNLNGLLLSDNQKNALITYDNGKNCAIFCHCDGKNDKGCSVCPKKHKKNCAICIKNQIQSAEKDIYKQICAIENMSFVNGPAQIYSNSTASNLLKSTKTGDKKIQATQTLCAEPLDPKSTEQSKASECLSQSFVLIAVVAVRWEI